MDGTMCKVKFCVASEAQLPQILSLYRSVIGKEGCTWDMFYPSEGTLKEDFAAKQLYVLQMGDLLIGAGSIVPENELDDLGLWQACGNAKELARIVIAPAWQGKGYGKLLVQRLCDQLSHHKCAAVHILVAKENHPAQQMYRQLGFRNKGDCQRYGLDFFAYEKMV